MYKGHLSIEKADNKQNSFAIELKNLDKNMKRFLKK